ncbi:MAG: glycosyltransferase [Solirubrobacteraceae bacterium]|nr:glycosyltransferase [Solirubrobacteraceae bacterium]
MRDSPVVSYVIRSFPKVSETFVVRELLSLQEAGVPVEIWSLVPDGEASFDDVPAAAPLATLVRRPPAGRAGLRAMMGDLLQALLRRPVRTARAISFAVGWAVRERDPRQLAALPYAAHLARHARGKHLHAHFANTPATTAVLAAMLSRRGRTASYTGHARDLWVATSPAFLAAKTRACAFAVSHSQFTLGVIERALAGELTAGTDNPSAPNGAGNGSGPHRADPPLYVITNGVERPAVLASPESREPDLIVATARMVEKKGLDTLIAAIGELVTAGRTGIRLELIGDGPERDALELQVARLRLADHVVLRGTQPPAEVQHTLQRAAIFALPARAARDGDTDGLPVAVLEAMAHGVPVIATPIAGLPEAVLDGETGLLVPPDDAVTLAAAIARLLDDAELRELLGTAAAGLIAERYDSARSALTLAEHFRRQE